MKETESNNKKKFLRELGILNASGAGIVLARSKEPLRTVEAIRDWTLPQEADDGGTLAYRWWNLRDGWCEMDYTDVSRPIVKRLGGGDDPLGCLNAIVGDAESATPPYPSGVYVMDGLIRYLDEIPALRWTIHDLSHKLTLTDHLVVILAPEGYTLPDDIAQQVPTLDFLLPSREELGEVLEHAIQDTFKDDADYEDPFSEAEREEILSAAAGLTYAEAVLAFSQAVVMNDDTWPLTPARMFQDVVLKSKTEAVKRGDTLELEFTVPEEEVAGLKLLRNWAHQTRGAFSEEARAFGVAAPKGALFVGLPGTGKSLMARVIGNIFGLPLLRLDIGKLMRGIVGETEQKTRAAFLLAEAMAPCVVWVDEIEKELGGAGNSNDSGVTSRFLGNLLNHMQENRHGIFWVFTANDVTGLPPELLRKGRLDEIWSLDLPTAEEREAVFEIHIRKCKHDPEGIDLKKLVKGSEGYVAAEIEAAVKEAVKECFFRGGAELKAEDILKKLSYMTKMTEAFKGRCDKIRRWSTDNARPASESDEDAPVVAGRAVPETGRRRIGRRRRGRGEGLN